MSRTVSILLALIAGLAVGVVLRVYGGPDNGVAGFLQPIGQLWLNALRMTLVPLVFCLMTAGVAGLATTATDSGRQVGIAVGVFLSLLLAAAIVGAATAEALMLIWPVHPIDSALAAQSVATVAAPPSFVSVLVNLIPLNPVAAAAEAAMVPLIVFAAIFGVAISRLPGGARGLLVDFFKAAADAMLIIVNWVLSAAPIGIFVLTLEAAANIGLGVALGLVQYVLLLSMVLAVGLVCATMVGLLSGIQPARFFRAALGPQALAASTQSSMACLPALVQAAESLELPRPFVATMMPLAVTTFRFGNVCGGIAAGLIGAQLFGIHPGYAAITLAIVIGVLTNVGVIGLPGQAVLLAAYGPIFTALGTPIEALTLLIAVFTLPDILDTTCNVTADLAATSLIARLAGSESKNFNSINDSTEIDPSRAGS
jgi:proton glutamate symport protein